MGVGETFFTPARTLFVPGMTPGNAMHLAGLRHADVAIEHRRPGGRPLPGWQAGVARAGGRSTWRTRCGYRNKHSFGPGIGSVKRRNGPTAEELQAASAWAFAVGLSNLALRPV